MNILAIIGEEYEKVKPRRPRKTINKNIFKLGEPIGTLGLVYWGKEVQKGTRPRTCMLVCPNCNNLFRGDIGRAKTNKIGPCC